MGDGEESIQDQPGSGGLIKWLQAKYRKSGLQRRLSPNGWWLRAQVGEDLESRFARWDPELVAETNAYIDSLEEEGAERAKDQPKVGGGGSYYALYFLTRALRPANVLETGVARGWSSAAILAGLFQNEHGYLMSSDRPPGSVNSEDDVGCVVPERFYSRWQLCKKDDASCLPELLENLESIDMFHYDSDKSYAGREYAINMVWPYMSPGSVIVMDDVKDNAFFKDWVTQRGLRFSVFPKDPKSRHHGAKKNRRNNLIGLVWL